MPVVPQVRRVGLRPRRALPLRRFLARAPRLLRQHPGDLVLVHVGLGRLGALDAVAGLAGVERLRDELTARATAAAGPRALVARASDVVLVLTHRDAVDDLTAALAAPVRTLGRDRVPLGLRPGVRCGVVEATPGLALDDQLDAAAAAARSAEQGCDDVVRAGLGHRDAYAARRRTEHLLNRAVPDGLLRLHYQPLVDLRTGT